MCRKLIYLVSFVLAVSLLMGSVSADVTKGLVGYWPLDGDATDASGSGLHGTINGNVVPAEDRFGTEDSAMLFPGASNSYIELGDPPELQITGAMTLAAWVRIDSYETNGRIIARISGSPQYSYSLNVEGEEYDHTGTFQVAASGSVLNIVNTADRIDFGPDEWFHIAGTFEPGVAMKVYINGQLDSNVLTDNVPTTQFIANTVRIGKSGTTWGEFKGSIDEVVVFNHALSKEEITLLYKQGVAAFTDSTLLKLSSIVREAEATAKELKPQEAIPFIESKIAEFERWTGKNLNHVGLHYKLLRSDLYFLLAKAKEAAGLPNKDIAAAYKHATLSYKNGGTALTWLFENVHADEYKSSIKAAIQKLHDGKYIYVIITKQLESTGNWPAFELFLDTVFGEAENPIAVAKSVENGLRADSTWGQKYLEYCRGKPQLKEYTLERLRKVAEAYEKKENFKNAAKAYRDIIERYESSPDAAELEFKVCQCLFSTGDYQAAISELDRFLAKNKSSNRSLSKDAMLLKGRCYIQLGEINKAASEFFTLTIEYPETKEAPESSFFIGYCYMLQGKFELAKEALNLVVKDYPQSSYASKARLCLTRIKSIIEEE